MKDFHLLPRGRPQLGARNSALYVTPAQAPTCDRHRRWTFRRRSDKMAENAIRPGVANTEARVGPCSCRDSPRRSYCRQYTTLRADQEPVADCLSERLIKAGATPVSPGHHIIFQRPKPPSSPHRTREILRLVAAACAACTREAFNGDILKSPRGGRPGQGKCLDYLSAERSDGYTKSKVGCEMRAQGRTQEQRRALAPEPPLTTATRSNIPSGNFSDDRDIRNEDKEELL